jgi:hypothetical protein
MTTATKRDPGSLRAIIKRERFDYDRYVKEAYP